MFIGSILRVCAIVSLSAVSIISSMLKAKVEDPGMINQVTPTYNSNPYNSNTGEINMYNNGAFSSQSRRFYGCAQPSYPMANVPTMGQFQQPMRPITFGSPLPQPSVQLQMALLQNGYPVPGYNANAYQGGYNAQAMYGYTPSMYSRRNMVPGTYPQQPPQQMNYNNYNPMNQYMSNGMYREPSYGMNYNYGNNNGYGYGYDSGVSALYGNSYDYGYTQSYQQPMMNYMYQQPQQQPVQSLGNYNSSIIGSAARYSYWTPSSDSSYAYYGYDDNVASYPTSYPQQQQPMYQQNPQMPPQRQMANQMMEYQPAGYTMEQWDKLRELDRVRKMEEMRNFGMQQNVTPQPQMPNDMPLYMKDMDGRLHNTIRPINADNGSGWYTKEEQNMAKAQSQVTIPVSPPMPQPNVPPFLQNGPARFYQQSQPQQQVVVQQPTVSKTTTGNPIMDKLLESQAIPEVDPKEVLAKAPIPTHVMKFGPPDDSEPLDMTKIAQPFCTFDDQPEKPKEESKV